MRMGFAAIIAAWLAVMPTAAKAGRHDPVAVVAGPSLVISGAQGLAQGWGRLPLFLSLDWNRPQPGVTLAVVTLHGADRDAAVYARIAREGLERASQTDPGAAAHTLLVTPQFLQTIDGQGRKLAPDLLRWQGNDWISGGRAAAPAPIGSFTALDAIVAHLSDRRLFPALRRIVFVGHSAGGQFVQRYAELTRADAFAGRSGIALRYVVANASSYGYFTPDRPVALGRQSCRQVDRWKYGMRDLPGYAGDATPADIEQRYAGRDIVYLLGLRDDDPNLPVLDKSCAAEAQGPTHLARGHFFFQSLLARHPGLHQRLNDIAGVGHDGERMLTSDCAIAAIYNVPLCGQPQAPLNTR